jgi:glucose-6-phosphate-specific signal transduction histidine kinase
LPLQRFWRGAITMSCAAAIAYGVLYSAALLLLQPERWPTALVAFGGAVLLAPLWWKLHDDVDAEA